MNDLLQPEVLDQTHEERVAAFLEYIRREPENLTTEDEFAKTAEYCADMEEAWLADKSIEFQVEPQDDGNLTVILYVAGLPVTEMESRSPMDPNGIELRIGVLGMYQEFLSEVAEFVEMLDGLARLNETEQTQADLSAAL